jgi:hypothetical protein
VYTRMHTPRFSGQPASAGDFVLTMTFSRPMRTSCENVGTVLPSFARKNFCPSTRSPTNARKCVALAGAQTNCARAHSSAERSTANPETTSKKLRTHFQKVELFFWLRLGDAHSALRGWRPIPAAPRSHSVLLCSGTEDIPSNYPNRKQTMRSPHRHVQTTPTNNRVYGEQRALSNHFDTKAVENFNPARLFGTNHAPRRIESPLYTKRPRSAVVAAANRGGPFGLVSKHA